MTSFQKFIVTAYRYLAVVMLLTILGTAAGYAFITLFYTFSTAWSTPTVLSQRSAKALQLKETVLSSTQTFDGLNSSLAALTAESALLSKEKARLEDLLTKVGQAVKAEDGENKTYAARLTPLQSLKSASAANAANLALQLKDQQASIEKELKAGLITKTDAVRSLATLNSLQMSAADSATSNAGLEHQIRDLTHSSQTLGGGNGDSASALALLEKEGDYSSKLASIEVKLAQNKFDITNKTQELAEVKKLATALQASPYFAVMQSDTPLNFAFVPYTNTTVAVGMPVYDCLLQVVFCHKIGSVKAIFNDEDQGVHPVFHRDIRGHLIQLDLTDASSAKSNVVFIGNAPLLF